MVQLILPGFEHLTEQLEYDDTFKLLGIEDKPETKLDKLLRTINVNESWVAEIFSFNSSTIASACTNWELHPRYTVSSTMLSNDYFFREED